MSGYLSPHAHAEILRHAVRQAKCALEMAGKVPDTEDVVADLTAVIGRLQSKLDTIGNLVAEMEEV